MSLGSSGKPAASPCEQQPWTETAVKSANGASFPQLQLNLSTADVRSGGGLRRQNFVLVFVGAHHPQLIQSRTVFGKGAPISIHLTVLFLDKWQKAYASFRGFT